MVFDTDVTVMALVDIGVVFQVFLACLVVAAAARPRDTVISIDQDNHKHTQKGQAGTAVTGTYQ